MFKKTLTAIIAATTLFGFTSANAGEEEIASCETSVIYTISECIKQAKYTPEQCYKVFEKNPNFENELNFIERTLLPIYF